MTNTRNCEFNTAELRLMDLVNAGLHGRKNTNLECSHAEWQEISELANKTRTSPYVYLAVFDNENCPKDVKNVLHSFTSSIVEVNYKLWMLTRTIVNKFESDDIRCAVLKGPACSVYFPVPEYRKSGDVDILVSPEDMDGAEKILLNLGFAFTEDHPHHKSFVTRDGIEIELHRMLAITFDSDQANSIIEKYAADGLASRTFVVLDEKLQFPTLRNEVNGLSLLLHMIQHFIVGGFGIKLLCDWMMYLENVRDEKEIESLKAMIVELKLSTFASAATCICNKYLGLSAEKASAFDMEIVPENIIVNLLRDIFETGEFGNESGDRMVLLEKKSLGGLLKQLHYQMKINHPKASKCPLIWPGLWIVTAIVFDHNNRKIRKVSTRSVIKNALERSEATNMADLKLFIK